MIYVFRTLIAPAALADELRTMCIALAGDAAEGLFRAPLSATGDDPPTHYISSGAVGAEFADALSGPEHMLEVCQAAELPVTLEQCAAILGACTVVDLDDEPVQATLERLGLRSVVREVVQ